MNRLPPRPDEPPSAEPAPDRFFQAALGHAADAAAAAPPELDELILRRAGAAAAHAAETHAVTHLLRHLPDAGERPSPRLDRRIVQATTPAAVVKAQGRPAVERQGRLGKWHVRLKMSFGKAAAAAALAAGVAMLVLQWLRPPAPDIDLPATAQAPEPPASNGLPAAPDHGSPAPPVAAAPQPSRADFPPLAQRNTAVLAAATNRGASAPTALTVERPAPDGRDEPASAPSWTSRMVAEGLFPDDECEKLKEVGFRCMGFKPRQAFELPDEGAGADATQLPEALRQQLTVFAEALAARRGTGKVVRVDVLRATQKEAAARARAVEDLFIQAGVDPALLEVRPMPTSNGSRPSIIIRRAPLPTVN